jgi:very-short-patch-repair endonuclease
VAVPGGLIGLSSTLDLADIPADRVVQVTGADAGTVALTVAEKGTGLAVVVAGPEQRWTTPADFVTAALTDLERVAVELLPAWLPESLSIVRPDVGGIAAVRIAASAHARRAHYLPSLLVDLAVLAVTGRRETRRALPAGTRGAQLARLVAEGFGRSRTVLLVPLAPRLTTREQDAIVAGAGWLAHNARMGVWLLGSLEENGDQVPRARLTNVVPRAAADVGRPHPASAVEAALEAALAAQSWAAGRRWNQAYQSNPLSPPVRLDLLWPRERCVVELDGPEHCHPVHFEADRQRDVQLQLDGYAVLRFTNARVIHDVGAVVHQIGTYLHRRRRETAEGTPWPTNSPRPRTRS